MSVLPSRVARPSGAVALRGLALGAIAGVIAVGTAAELAQVPLQRSFDVSAVAYSLDLVAVGVLLTIRRAPVLAAIVSLAAAVTGHFLGVPGGAAGLALFYAAFELASVGRRAPTVLAFALPFAWAGALMLPPAGVPIGAPGLLGPAAGMLWMAFMGATVRRARFESSRERTNPPAVGGLISGPQWRTRSTETGEMSALTPREREVVALVGTGLDNAAIAGILFVSPVTVKSHVNHAMGKLGTTTRAQLVARAHQYGLVANQL
ncbi:MAG: vraR3 [Frondihabitans sp.]|nr:vraR3 [Frondihabitans sp.]